MRWQSTGIFKKIHPGFRGRVSRKVAKIAKGEILMKNGAGPGVSQGV